MATDDADAGIYARESADLERAVQIGAAQGKVISVSFPRTPPEGAASEHPLLDRIDRYLSGEPTNFDDIEVALTVPTDQRTVLETVRSIPYGETVSIDALANMVPGFDSETDDDLASIRTALAENPTPLVIPDHRVRDGPGAAPSDVTDLFRSVEGL